MDNHIGIFPEASTAIYLSCDPGAGSAGKAHLSTHIGISDRPISQFNARLFFCIRCRLYKLQLRNEK